MKVWCLGNEMDGPWQMNHRTAHEYGRIANEVGRGMKVFDNRSSLSPADPHTPTCRPIPSGRRRCSSECFDNVDYISLHTYWDNWDDDT